MSYERIWRILNTVVDRCLPCAGYGVGVAAGSAAGGFISLSTTTGLFKPNGPPMGHSSPPKSARLPPGSRPTLARRPPDSRPMAGWSSSPAGSKLALLGYFVRFR